MVYEISRVIRIRIPISPLILRNLWQPKSIIACCIRIRSHTEVASNTNATAKVGKIGVKFFSSHDKPHSCVPCQSDIELHLRGHATLHQTRADRRIIMSQNGGLGLLLANRAAAMSRDIGSNGFGHRRARERRSSALFSCELPHHAHCNCNRTYDITLLGQYGLCFFDSRGPELLHLGLAWSSLPWQIASDGVTWEPGKNNCKGV